ncbi:uncharacterized protein LOC132804153 [Ziziphus jujuba]|uniref:Uncharacterized protein LOC132804153 n=1 Tax=Ziziphus jujuba TaxID=326968 RepID=A0ABM4ABL2_ZIZJJ|nr:uncharacterized protein LOC132804153 [Ziziphus jujuba]
MASPKKLSCCKTLTSLKRVSQKIFDRWPLLSSFSFVACKTLTSVKKVSQKIFNRWPLLSSFSFVALILIFFADSIFSSNLSHQNAYTINENIFLRTQKAIAKMQFSMQEKVDKLAMLDGEYEIDPMIPPKNVTKGKRIKWFQQKLPEFEILSSTNLSKQFHGRVLEFLNNGCSIQFYMVWLSPARFFGTRDFLSIDTLFYAHPQGCLMIISRTMDSSRGYRILKPLLDRGFKVLAVTPDLPFLVKNTPAEAWLEELKSGKIDPGFIPLSQNLCNLIRLTVLHKYGGVYLDTDMIVLRDFSELKNSVGAQTIDPVSKRWLRLNGAVMVFDIHHPILLDFIEEFSSTFDGNSWGFNGPYLVSRVMKRVGGRRGYNMTVMRPEAFYPVNWSKIHRLFRKPERTAERRWVERTVNELTDEGGKTYAVHLWNKKSKGFKIEEGSVMERLILHHCVICENI